MDNRRNTIVINKKFQYQYSLMIAALAVLLVNGFLITQIVMPGETAFSIPTNTALVIGLIELILIVAIWYGSLRASHRIAGPVHVFTRELSKLGQGDLTCDIALRDSDMFKIEGEAINNSVAALRTKVDKTKTLAEQVLAAQASGQECAELVEALCNEVAEFKTNDEDA
ncbi:MAG: hypothetical protein AB8C02_02380 [Halioglobus sp.]